jgi:hypothetical protein
MNGSKSFTPTFKDILVVQNNYLAQSGTILHNTKTLVQLVWYTTRFTQHQNTCATSMVYY